MHIELDTDKATIKLHGKVNLEELLITLDALEVDTENWTIIPDTVIVETPVYITVEKPTTIIIKETQPLPWVQPWTPAIPTWNIPTIWCGTTTAGTSCTTTTSTSGSGQTYDMSKR